MKFNKAKHSKTGVLTFRVTEEENEARSCGSLQSQGFVGRAGPLRSHCRALPREARCHGKPGWGGGVLSWAAPGRDVSITPCLQHTPESEVSGNKPSFYAFLPYSIF